MSPLTPDEQRQAILHNGEPLEDDHKFKYSCWRLISNARGTKEVRSRIKLTHIAFSRLHFCFLSRREISLRTKGKVNQTTVRLLLLYGCETWPVRVADERMLGVFENGSIRRILNERCSDCVPTAILRRRLCLTSIPALLVQRRSLWFGHAARRHEDEPSILVYDCGTQICVDIDRGHIFGVYGPHG